MEFVMPSTPSTGEASPAHMDEPLLSIQALSVSLETADGLARVLDDVTFDIPSRHWTGLVGETGCGKSMTAAAIIGLLPPSARASGRIVYKGTDLLTETESELRKVRGSQIAMVFQDPGVAINPALKIGFQIAETIATHQNVHRSEARRRAMAVLQDVGLDARVMNQYAYELSGGMRQRVMIGLALACNPSLILADEPTSNLDVTIQRDILVLIKELSKLYTTAILFITHDLMLVGQICDDIVVMYAGIVMERGPTEAVLRRTFHPYTRALVNAIPTIDARRNVLEEIEGSVPTLQRPPGCVYAPRCKHQIPGLCDRVAPPEREVDEGIRTRCHLY